MFRSGISILKKIHFALRVRFFNEDFIEKFPNHFHLYVLDRTS